MPKPATPMCLQSTSCTARTSWRADNYRVVAAAYCVELEETMRHLSREVEASCRTGQPLVKDAFVLVMDTMQRATLTAYFGRKLLDQIPEIMADLRTYIAQGFWPLMFGVPRLLLLQVYRARDRVLAGLAAAVAHIEPADGMSKFVQEKQKLSREIFTQRGVATEHLGLLFG